VQEIPVQDRPISPKGGDHLTGSLAEVARSLGEGLSGFSIEGFPQNSTSQEHSSARPGRTNSGSAGVPH
jgi:hypothetical protein